MLIKKIILKDIIKEITLNKKRFLSILLVIAIGFGFSLGLNSSYSYMADLAKKYYDKTNLFDIKIESSSGFTKNSALKLKEIKGVDDISLAKTLNSTITIDNKDYVVKVNSINNKKNIDKLTLTEGRYPMAINEGLVQEDFLNESGLSIGDLVTLKIENQYDLKAKKIKIVGTIKDSYYFSRDKINNIENKKIDYYMYLEENNFDTDYYTEGFIKIKDSNKYDTYKKEYDNYISKYTNIIKDTVINNMAYTNNEKQLSLENEIKNLEYDLNELNQTDLPIDSLNDSIKQITQKISDKKDELLAIKNYDLKVTKRTELEAFYEYKEDISNIKNIAFVFSLIFLTITITYVLVTITKMAFKKKNEFMILNAYGYGKSVMLFKYLFYVFLVSALGILIGTLFISKIVELIVCLCYKNAYDIPIMMTKLGIKPAFKLGIIVICLILIFTLFLIKMVIKNKLSNKKINIITKAFVMIVITLLTALVLFSLSIKNSFLKTFYKEYEKINKYQMVIDLKNGVNQDDKIITQNNLMKNKEITNIMFISKSNVFVKTKDKKQNAYLVILNDANNLNDFITINHDEKVNFNNGVIITDDLFKKLNLKENEKIKIALSNDKEITVKVLKQTKNYIDNFIYISSSLYKDLSNQNVRYNKVLIKADKKLNELKNNLSALENVNNVTLTKGVKDNYKNKINSIKFFGMFLIIMTLLFCYVIINNLVKHVLSEKKIETLKNLSFSNNDILKSINKKFIKFCVLSIIIGIVIGNLLLYLIALKYKSSFIRLSFSIDVINYIITILIIILFLLIIMFKIYNELKKESKL